VNNRAEFQRNVILSVRP